MLGNINLISSGYIRHFLALKLNFVFIDVVLVNYCSVNVDKRFHDFSSGPLTCTSYTHRGMEVPNVVTMHSLLAAIGRDRH